MIVDDVGNWLSEFSWQRFTGEFETRQSRSGGGGQKTLAQDVPEHLRIRAVEGTGEWEPYRPFQMTEKPYLHFAPIEDESSLRWFLERFGPLTRDGTERHRGDVVDVMLGNASAMRDIWGAANSGDGDLHLDDDRLRIRSPMMWFARDPFTKKVRLSIQPQDLLAGIWLQFGFALSSPITIKACRHCGAWFETGPGTGKKVTAEFCSAAHQIAFNNALKGKKKG